MHEVRSLTRSPIALVCALSALLCLGGAVSDAEIRGRVVKVADGDTITILDAGNTQHKIRLHGIDAPESHQAFGQKAKQHLSSLVFGKDVVVKVQDTDRYGRTVGKVFADGADANLEMIRAGLAWHYKRYDKSPEYAAAESEARANKLGLWQDPNPIRPSDFRKTKRKGK